MEIDIKVALIAAISALITTLIANYFARQISNKELIEKYRMIYFENQLESYRKFWSILKPISRYTNSESPIFKKEGEYYLDLRKSDDFSNAITDFFFSNEGIMLDRDTRKTMFNLRDHLEALNKNVSSKNNVAKISPKDAKDFRRLRDPLFNAVRTGSNLINLEFKANKLGIRNFRRTKD